jgi:hypothetical protein
MSLAGPSRHGSINFQISQDLQQQKKYHFTNCSIAQEIFAENQGRQSAAFTGATTVTA